MLISIIIHALIVVGVYYVSLINQSGSKVTKAAGVNAVIGTKINIKMMAADKPAPSSPKSQQKVTPVKNPLKSTATSNPSAIVVKAKTEIGFTKKEISNTPVVKKVTKLVTKTENSLQNANQLLKKNEIIKTIKKTIEKKANGAVTKTNNVTKKKLKEKTLVAQKGVRHTGDNVNKSQINMGNSKDTKTPWNQYKSAVFSAINAQKIYPKQAKLRRTEGTVVVKFDITKLGNISRFTLIKKVGSEHLNRSTKHLFEQLYLPQRPESVIGFLPVTLTVPIEYSLN